MSKLIARYWVLGTEMDRQLLDPTEYISIFNHLWPWCDNSAGEAEIVGSNRYTLDHEYALKQGEIKDD